MPRCVLPLLMFLPALAGAVDFAKDVQPFFTEHCDRCHNEKKHKGELRLDTLSKDFSVGASAMHWADVMDRLSSGQMPPDDEPQPKTEDATRIVEWLAARLKEGEAARMAKREPVSFYKLTREEYANTLRDLLGVTYDATDPTALPEDPNWQGFERIGSVLSLSPAHVEKYFAAAEGALNEAMPAAAPKPLNPKDQHWDAIDIRGGPDRVKLKEQGLLDKVRLDVWPGSTFQGQPGAVRQLSVPATGDYKVRVKLSGLKPAGGRAPHVSIYVVDLDRILLEQDVVTDEDKPVTLEARVHLPAGNHPIRLTNEAPGPSNLPRAGRNGRDPFFSIKAGRPPWQTKLTDEQGLPILPFLIVDWVEWQGPLIDATPTFAQAKFLPQDSKDNNQVRATLSRFANLAFRRPARPEELARFEGLMASEVQSGEAPEAALKTALLAILCADDFFYLVEGTEKQSRTRINDFELASRLSYFLWSTMPDEALRAVADNGTLHQPEVLRTQVRRMTNDARIARFTQAFPRQWLQLHRVGMFPPDKKLYPAYDDYLQKSMIKECTAYFGEVLSHNLSLREFISSDWTMLNARLAEHYEIGGITEDRFQRVALRPQDHRGGLLTQAAVLSLTSDGSRHRPVHRGKWVLESIIGKPPPPPPANVKPIETTPATQPKATLRMKLAAHQSDANCASCHRRIDPLGLAFDNYDAIGRWRTEETVKDGAGDNPKVDASGQLIDGRRFDDAEGFKKLLLADIDKFNAAFVEKLATFALRRAMSIDDRKDLQALTAQSKAADYRVPAIVEALVMSELFQRR